MADTHPKTGAPGPRSRRIPPLVWIVVALLVAWLVVALVQRGGTHVTPSGGTAPQQAEGPAIVEPAPPTATAPGTPVGVVNGPNQPGGADQRGQ